MFQKITRAQARARYESNLDFVMVASNLHPDSFAAASIGIFTRMTNTPFDQLVNEYRYYNCINRETGRGVAFYVET